MGAPGEPQTLHGVRLETVLALLRELGVRRVLDLGCGAGALLLRLAMDPEIEKIVGIDVSDAALDACRENLRRLPEEVAARVSLARMSFAAPDAVLAGYDAAVMLETIEHIEPERLSQVERGVFAALRPRHVLITTPNAEMNALLGVPEFRFRERDHRFEWTREKFERWAEGVAARNRYDSRFLAIGAVHPRHGAPTQAALFARA